MNFTTTRNVLLCLIGIGVIPATSFSAEPAGSVAASAMPDKPQAQSKETQSAQLSVDKQAAGAAADKRKAILADATAAVDDTEKALKALEDKKPSDALQALASATGKLELIVARDPALGLAPANVTVVTHDLFANPETIKAVTSEAKKHLEAGEIQEARRLLFNLASEIDVRTTNIPLATYPSAIKAISPLIDAGKLEEARAALQAVLNTQVVTTEVIPLPKVRADYLVKDAQGLAEKNDRTNEDSEKLSKDLSEARNQLQLAELLGYGKKTAYQPIYEQISQIEKKTSAGKSGKGWFDKMKKQLTTLF